ncbi:MAG TPA: creatininase family protein [Gaiellaceae bacterium]
MNTSLGSLSWQEAAGLDAERTVAVIPVAALEQHGPHLPLDTDTFLVTTVVEAAAQLAGTRGPVLVPPTIFAGSSEHHMAFAGTISLRPETLAAVVRDVCLSLAQHDFRRLLIVNGHGGNRALLAAAVQSIGAQAPVSIATLDYWTLAAEAVTDLRESPPGGMAHACEFETSLMLHLRPESVRTELIAHEIPETRFSLERLDLFERAPLTVHWKTHELSSSGVLGAPDLATAEKGRVFFEACVAGLADLIEELRTVALPDRR